MILDQIMDEITLARSQFEPHINGDVFYNNHDGVNVDMHATQPLDSGKLT
jgi:hypothetical protein